MTPAPASCRPTSDARRAIGSAYGGRGREAAAEVALPVEDLVVGRDDLDVAVRRHLELDARTAHVRPDEPLLDDAAARGEARQIRVDAHAAGVERHALEPLGDALPLTVAAGRGQPAEVDDGVALAGDAVVELDHHLDEPGPRGTQAHDRLDRRAAAGDVRDAQRMRNAGQREQLAAAALRPELLVARVGAVERHVERQREVALQLRGHVGHHVAERAGRDGPADPREQAWAREQLLGQRARRRIVGGEQREAGAGVGAHRRREQREVVLDDGRRDRGGGHVDEHEPGIPQRQQQGQQPFLVRLRLGRRLVPPLDRSRGHHDHAARAAPRAHRLVDGSHPRLQPFELRCVTTMSFHASTVRQRRPAAQGP